MINIHRVVDYLKCTTCSLTATMAKICKILTIIDKMLNKPNDIIFLWDIDFFGLANKIRGLYISTTDNLYNSSGYIRLDVNVRVRVLTQTTCGKL